MTISSPSGPRPPAREAQCLGLRGRGAGGGRWSRTHESPGHSAGSPGQGPHPGHQPHSPDPSASEPLSGNSALLAAAGPTALSALTRGLLPSSASLKRPSPPRQSLSIVCTLEKRRTVQKHSEGRAASPRPAPTELWNPVGRGPASHRHTAGRSASEKPPPGKPYLLQKALPS